MTIIDFGAAMIGDSIYDLAKIVWEDVRGNDSVLSSVFLQSWREVTDDVVNHEILSLYIASHALAAMAWVDKQQLSTDDDLSFDRLALGAFAKARGFW